MAVGSGEIKDLNPVPGIRVSTVSAGIKKPGRRDLVLMEIAEGAEVAGVFTRNQFCAAPVQLAKQHLGQRAPRYFLINTGNANAGTGERGLLDALACCQSVAEVSGSQLQEVLPFSTGVIGEILPVDKIKVKLADAYLGLKEDAWLDAAHGIMTTDTRPKAVSRRLQWQGQSLSVTGIAKGAGMIKPNMATMLGFVFTDAKLGGEDLQALLAEAVNLSFNRITVDGDTSTNDACMLVATGKSGLSPASDPALQKAFRELIIEVFKELAQGLVKDAEGASKFVTIRVTGAAGAEEALKVAYTIAESPLVKTALFASDPNWGRILACVGRAGVDNLDINSVHIYLGDVCIVEKGCVAASYREELGAAAMAGAEILIRVDLGRGEMIEEIWTTDLGYDYVKINAEYRT